MTLDSAALDSPALDSAVLDSAAVARVAPPTTAPVGNGVDPRAGGHQPAGLDMRTDDDALLWLIDLVSSHGTTVADQRRRERYAVLPSPTRPRYLVPLGHGRATSINLRAGQSGWTAQALRTIVTPAARLGALHLLARRLIDIPSGDPRHPTLAEHLAERTGQHRLVLSLSLGPPRPNRKPILQLTTPDGTVVAFAKVSTNAHTAGLVTNEAAALRALGTRPHLGLLTVPRLLDHFRWKGHDVVLSTALATPHQSRLPALPLTAEVVRTIAELDPLTGGLQEQGPAADSRWWATVESRVAALEGHSANTETSNDGTAKALRRTADAWRARWGTIQWAFGHWHGDLTPWNAAWDEGRLLVWDWERSGGPVPLGLDALHNAFQQRLLADGASVADATAHATRSQRGLLAELGVDEADVGGMGGAYLMELALRLAEDAQFGPLGPHARLLSEVLIAARTEASGA